MKDFKYNCRTIFIVKNITERVILTMSKNLHAGHRQRVKARYLSEGLDAFEDHQVLELLLFYAIPRKDTNELAHRMIKEFGSLAGLLDRKSVV